MVVAGKFELYKDKAGKYRFRLKAGNGQVIAVDEAYESRAAAENGIKSVKENAASATIDHQKMAGVSSSPTRWRVQVGQPRTNRDHSVVGRRLMFTECRLDVCHDHRKQRACRLAASASLVAGPAR